MKKAKGYYTAYYDGVSVTVKSDSLVLATARCKAKFKALGVGSAQARFVINKGKV